MELVEIVVQGLQGARELVRAPMAPGVTVFHAGPRERLFVRLVLDLLYPKGTEPTLEDVDDPGAQSRVGVVVVGRDGQRYRLLLDVKTGRRTLQRYINDQAEPITGAANEIAQAVTATIGFPQEDVLRGLLFSALEDLPSRRAKAAPAPGASASSPGRKEASTAKAEKPLPPGFGDTNSGVSVSKPLPPGFSDVGAGAPVADRAGRNDEQLRNRIAELDALLQTQGNVKALEFELDGLQKKNFEIEARMRPLTTLKRSLKHAEEQVKRFAALASVPADLMEKGERLAKLRVEHDRDTARLEDDKRKLLDDSAAATGGNQRRKQPSAFEVAQREPLVKYGVAVGLGAIAVGLVGALTSDTLRWVALLDIPALGCAVFGGIRVLSSLEEGERTRRRIGRLVLEQKRLDDRFRIDEEQVQGVLDKYGFTLEQLPEVEGQLRARDEAVATLARTTELLAEAQAGDGSSLEQEQAEVSARVRALEEQLSAAGAGFSNAADIHAEKEELENLLAGGTPQASAPVADPEAMTENLVINPAERAAYADAPPAGAERSIADDLAKPLLELAADVLLVPVEAVCTQVQGRAAQILGALSDGRLRELRFGGRGETSVIDTANDTIAFGSLPAFDRDLTWLALKIALIEIVVKRGRLPVIFDRSLDFLADAKGPMLQKMLQFLAASTQVVSISEKPALGGRSA